MVGTYVQVGYICVLTSPMYVRECTYILVHIEHVQLGTIIIEEKSHFSGTDLYKDREEVPYFGHRVMKQLGRQK